MDVMRLLSPISAKLAARVRLAERLASGRWNVYQKMIALHGEDTDMRHTKRFAADLVSALLLCVAGGVVCGIAAEGDLYVMASLAGLAVFMPFLQMKRLDGKIAAKRRQLVFELPELLNKLTLLVNAGETVQGALMRCADAYTEKGQSSPLAVEIVTLANRLRNNESFPVAMDRFSKRCLVAEVSVFTTTVLMNYRRGGDTLVMSLLALNRELWEKRKAMTRVRGEEASSKLIFPMLLILLAVMAIVAAPAIMLTS